MFSKEGSPINYIETSIQTGGTYGKEFPLVRFSTKVKRDNASSSVLRRQKEAEGKHYLRMARASKDPLTRGMRYKQSTLALAELAWMSYEEEASKFSQGGEEQSSRLRQADKFKYEAGLKHAKEELEVIGRERDNLPDGDKQKDMLSGIYDIRQFECMEFIAGVNYLKSLELSEEAQEEADKLPVEERKDWFLRRAAKLRYKAMIDYYEGEKFRISRERCILPDGDKKEYILQEKYNKNSDEVYRMFLEFNYLESLELSEEAQEEADRLPDGDKSKAMFLRKAANYRCKAMSMFYKREQKMLEIASLKLSCFDSGYSDKVIEMDSKLKDIRDILYRIDLKLRYYGPRISADVAREEADSLPDGDEDKARLLSEAMSYACEAYGFMCGGGSECFEWGKLSESEVTGFPVMGDRFFKLGNMVDRVLDSYSGNEEITTEMEKAIKYVREALATEIAGYDDGEYLKLQQELVDYQFEVLGKLQEKVDNYGSFTKIFSILDKKKFEVSGNESGGEFGSRGMNVFRVVDHYLEEPVYDLRRKTNIIEADLAKKRPFSPEASVTSE